MATKKTKTEKKLRPWIVCAGENGRAVVFGWSAEEPKPEEPCELRDAKMILRWEGAHGLFGLAQHGPASGARITCAVESTRCVARQVLAVSEDAARKLVEWPNA